MLAIFELVNSLRTSAINTYGISEKSFSLIRESFQKYPEGEEVLTFGSRAKGTAGSGSDIDLAITEKKCTQNFIYQPVPSKP